MLELRRGGAGFILGALALAWSVAVAAAAPASTVDPKSYRVETMADGLVKPWSMSMLPDGRLLVTEIAGRLKVIGPDGATRSIAIGALPDAYLTEKTGLMDVAVDPRFADNALIYLTYAYGSKAANNTRLVRARLVEDRLADMRVLFSATAKAGDSHYGGRMAFLADETLLLTLGDAFDRREDAQNKSNHLGKTVRLTRDGIAPPDNPFAKQAGAAPEIYSLGHRNVQGVAIDADGSALIAEHGPRGGDEINRLTPGGNFGWPVVTGGLDYTFARVSPFRDLPGYERPLLEWTPSIAPAGFAIHRGQAFSDWNGDLLVAALKERSVRRVIRQGGRIVGQQTLLSELGERFRDVRVAPDGSILALTDGPGAKLLRVSPAN